MTENRTALTWIAAIAALAAIAVAAWMLFLRDDDSADSAAPRIVSAAELAEFAADLDHPLYWAGEVDGTEMELTETDDGRVYVRYLDDGADAGDPRPAFLTIGTYPSDDPAAAVAAAQQQSGSLTEESDSGQQLVSNEQRPTSVYFADPAGRVQIEVYDPEPDRALDVAKSGDVAPLS